jgi:hypothetical protein
LPERFDPAATGDPLAGPCLIHPRFNLGEKIFQGGNAFKIQVHLALAHTDEVIVRVRQSRQYRLVLQIDDASFRSCQQICAGIRAYENNATVSDRHGFGVWLLFIHRVDISMNEKKIGRNDFRCGGRKATQQDAENDEQGFHALPLLKPG